MMPTLQRSWLTATLMLTLVAGAALPHKAVAQQYPNRDIRFICAFPPGSGADVLVRFFAEQLRPIANRTIIVENRSGAGGNIAIEHVARSKPDGYTVFVHAGSAVAAGMHLYKNPPVDVGKAITIAATINRQPFMLVVDAKSPYKTVADLTAAMKQKGDKASYAAAAPTGRIMGEIYKQTLGLKAVEVNYKTAPDSINDMLSGAVDYGMHDPVFSLAQAREGRLRILAHSSGQRLQAIPEIPTMAESGVPGMDLTSWWCVHVPIATPRPIVDQLNKWMVDIVGTEETKKFLNQFGGDPFILTPDQAQALFIKDEKAWGEYVKMAKIEPQG
jgi:tripartite-type tricarboxylate transporter receptor subunit TctC